MKQEKFYLSGKEALALRGLGHHLKPTAMVGKEGVTPAVMEALEAVLAAHELVKVKVQEGCPLEREAAAEQLAAGSKAKIAQIIGRMILLYRPKPPEKAAPASRNLKPGRPSRGRSGKAGVGSVRGKGGSAAGGRSRSGCTNEARSRGGAACEARSKGGSASETRSKGGAAAGTRGRKAVAPRGGRPVAGTAGKASARRQQGRASGKR